MRGAVRNVVLMHGLSLISPNNAGLTYDNYITLVEKSATRFRASRPSYLSQTYMTPGCRCAFTTTANAVAFDVVFNGSVLGEDAQYIAGWEPWTAVILSNGIVVGEVTETNVSTGSVARTVSASGLGPGVKTIELVWPYMRPMDLVGVRVSRGATIAPVTTSPSKYVAAGDSITHGQKATKPNLTWVWVLSKSLGFQLQNTGYALRRITGGDGTRDGALGGKITTYLIGYNDYASGQGSGTTLTQSGDAIASYLTTFFAANTDPSGHLFVISPIYSTNTAANPTWTLQQYRDEISSRCAAFAVANPTLAYRLHYVNGLTVMTNSSDRLYDGIHPNDTGEAEIAANMLTIVTPYLTTYAEDFTGNMITTDFSGWTLDNTGSGSSNPVVTANAATAPDGSNTAYQIAFARGASGFSRLQKSAPNTVNGTSYTESVWLKIASPGFGPGLRLGGTNGTTTSLTTSWQRFTLSGASTGGNLDAQLLIWSSYASSPASVTVYAWGPKVVPV